jgi:uncharacterized protein
MRKLMIVAARFFLIAIGLSFTPLVFAASFDCNKARTLVEQAICSNAELSSLDEQMAMEYKEALRKTENKESIETNRKKWLATRNNCKNIKCLKAVYEDRISELRRLSGHSSYVDKLEAELGVGTSAEKRVQEQSSVSVARMPPNETQRPSIAESSTSGQETESQAIEDQKLKDFIKQMGATLVYPDSFKANPYRYKGTTIALGTVYSEMLDENTSLFLLIEGPNFAGYPIVVSGLSPKHSLGNLATVILVGQVVGSKSVPGRGATAPVLSFVALFCPHVRNNQCGDVHIIK